MLGVCSLILLILAVYVNSACNNFQCAEKNTTVIIGGVMLDCPKNTFCNKLGNWDCKPCVENYCNFKCTNETTVEIQGMNLTCQQNYFCNTTNNPQCLPCLPGKCNSETKNFECIDEKKVLIEGILTVECEDDLVCNANFLAPCTPCIKDDSESGSTTTTTMTTLLPPVNDKPCTGNRTRNCFEGPSGKYYRCNSFWNGTIESQLRNCDEINFDAKCYQSGVCK